MSSVNAEHHSLDRYIKVNEKFIDNEEIYLTKRSSITCDERDFPLTLVIYMREMNPIDSTTMFIGLTKEGFQMSIAVPKNTTNWHKVKVGDIVTFDALIRHSTGKSPIPRAFASSNSNAVVMAGYAKPHYKLAIPEYLPQHGHEIFLTVNDILPRNNVNASKKAPWQVIGMVNDERVYLKIFPSSTRQTLTAVNVNIGDVIHASPVTISRESYMGVEKLSCYVTWNSVVNILVDQHRDPIIEVDSVDHPVTCQKLIETASNATKTIIEIVVVTMREVKNSGTWITDVDGANKISFNRCALNAIPMCRDNAWDIGTTLKLKAVIQQNVPDVRLGYISHSVDHDVPRFTQLANFNKYECVQSLVESDTPVTPAPEVSPSRKRMVHEGDYDRYFEQTPKSTYKKEKPDLKPKPLDFSSPSNGKPSGTSKPLSEHNGNIDSSSTIVTPTMEGMDENSATKMIIGDSSSNSSSDHGSPAKSVVGNEWNEETETYF